MNSSSHVPAVVVQRRDVSSGLWIVRLRPEEKIEFLPGQYVTVGLPGAGRMVERPYSVASAPHEPELEFFLEVVPGGHLSPHLYKVEIGGTVQVRRLAKGQFLFDDRSGRPFHFMVSTVTGVAPFVSMLREMTACGDSLRRRVALLQAASVSAELGYAEELTAMARAHDWFTYIPSVSRTWLDPGWRGEIGRAEDLVRKHAALLGFTAGETTAYACGNPNMIENVKGVFQRAGFPADSFKQEIYWVAKKGE